MEVKQHSTNKSFKSLAFLLEFLWIQVRLGRIFKALENWHSSDILFRVGRN